MKKTILFDEHLKLGGNIVDFAGWQLPVLYTSIIEEHIATRTKAGMFDVSHMGEFLIKGNQSKNLIERLIPTRMDKLENGKAMYSCLCNENGGVIDDIFIFMISENEFYLVVNAANVEADFNWIKKNNNFHAELINESDATAKIDLQGPESYNILKQIIPDTELGELKRFHFYYSKFNNEKLMISTTGYTGEKGYELYLNNKNAALLWNDLLIKGKEFGLKPAGLAPGTV